MFTVASKTVLSEKQFEGRSVGIDQCRVIKQEHNMIL